MIEVIGEILPLAIGLALSPFPLIAITLLALSERGRGPGVAFLFGRFITATILVFVCAELSEALEKSGQTEPVVAVLRVIVGLTLLWLAVRKWGKRPGPDEDPVLPKWMDGLEEMGAVKSLGLSIILMAANPKELLFLVGAGLTIGAAELSLGETVVVVLAYVILACATVAAPVVIMLFGGETARAKLDSFRTWLVRNNAAVMSVVLIVIGAVLIGGGLSELAAVFPALP